MYMLLLRQIANILMLNIQHYDNIGLLKGRQGVLLYLYHFSRYMNTQVYSDFSDNLLDIQHHINKKRLMNFTQGLSGVGWSLDYLIKNNFIEADEDALEDIDKAIDSMSIDDYIKDLESDIPLFSNGLYFLQRGFSYSIYKALIKCEELLERDSIEIPLSYANSIFYVLNKTIVTQGKMENVYESILNKLFICIEKEIINKKASLLDSYLLNNNIRNIIVPTKKYDWNCLLQECEKPSLGEIAWVNFIYKYDDIANDSINETEIQKIINETWNSDPKELYLYNGLAGIGLEILRRKNLMSKQ